MRILVLFKKIFKTPFVIGTLFIIAGISILLNKKLPFFRYYTRLDEDENNGNKISRLIIGVGSILLGLFTVVYFGIIN